jgi:hypothetical protein
MTRFQIYFTESRICELFPGGMDQAHEWITGYFKEFPIPNKTASGRDVFKIEIGEMGFEPGDAGFYAFIEDGEIDCKLGNAIRFAKLIVKGFNELSDICNLRLDGEPVGDRYEDLVTDRFVFEDAQISVIKDGE